MIRDQGFIQDPGFSIQNPESRREMRITLNNRVEELEGDRLTVTELLKVKNFTFKMLIIKINGRLIEKPDYDSSEIVEGDDVQVLHLISGG